MLQVNTHLAGKPVYYFKRLLTYIKKQGSTFTKEVKGSERALVASFVVSEHIAMEMKAPQHWRKVD